MPTRHGVMLAVFVAAGCGSAPSTADAGPDAATPPDAPPGTDAFFPANHAYLGPTERRAQLRFPSDGDGPTRRPLFVLLHGYMASGALQDAYFGFSREVRAYGGYALIPEGTMNELGDRFWYVDEACCDPFAPYPDDDAYIMGLIDQAVREHAVDPSRIYLAGHSNGAFFALRLACDHSDRFAAVFALAGSEGLSNVCAASRPVSVLQVHGTLDTVVPVIGGTLYPGLQPFAPRSELLRRWVERDGCDATPVSDTPIDFEVNLPGAETTRARYSGCDGGSLVEAWTITRGDHIPLLAEGAMARVVAWLGERRL